MIFLVLSPFTPLAPSGKQQLLMHSISCCVLSWVGGGWIQGSDAQDSLYACVCVCGGGVADINSVTLA